MSPATLDEFKYENQYMDDAPESIASFDAMEADPCDDWRIEALDRLEAILRLGPGWDSHGAYAPDFSTVRSAAFLLLALYRAGVSKPHIYPTPSGGVQFHWENGPVYFEIEFLDLESARYYFVDRDLRLEDEGDILAGRISGRIVALIQRAALTI